MAQLTSLRRVAHKDSGVVQVAAGCFWFVVIVAVFFAGVFVGMVILAFAGRH